MTTNPHIQKEDVLAAMQGRYIDFYSQFGAFHPSGSEFRGQCPIHGGKRDSFSVKAEDGLWHCFSECGDIGGDVFAFLSRKDGLDFPDALEALARWSGTTGPEVPRASSTSAVSPKKVSTAKRIVATYNYTDEEGTLLFQVVRYEPKDFRQRRPDGKDGWIPDLKGTAPVLYRLPEVIAATLAGKPVYICEGEKDVDALAALGLTATTAPMGAKKWKDNYTASLCGAGVIILPDNDADGAAHGRLVADALSGKAKRVRVVALPGLPEKGDVSDWLAAVNTASGNAKKDLNELVEETSDWVPSQASTPPNMHPLPESQAKNQVKSNGDYGTDGGSIPYRETPRGLVHDKPSRDGKITVPLANFTARIAADIIEDDGAETRRLFEITAHRAGRSTTFSIPAASFATMNWPTEHLGAGALLYPGIGTKDHARAAIQLLSGDPPIQHVFAHTGWREVTPGEWQYLHAGGTIGSVVRKNVPEENVSEAQTVHVSSTNLSSAHVSLSPALERYCLPEPPQSAEAIQAVRASLCLLDLMPDALSFCLLGATYRSAIESSDFSVFLAGPSGAFKSEVAALFQQHFGKSLDARHLPAAWSSTDNFLEGLAFTAKDALLVIDDFAPTGTTMDVQRLHSKADRVLRAQGNNAARGRMRAEGTLRLPKPPRGLILSTGEDVPQGVSLRGRMCILELTPGDVSEGALTLCQVDAAGGQYAAAMAGFLSWLSPRYAQTKVGLREEITRLRTEAAQSQLHRRTPEITANLAAGLRYFLRFAVNIGAMDKEEALALWERGWSALGAAAQAQMRHQTASEPTLRFLELLSAALASGKAHVAGMDGDKPVNPERWGWRAMIVGSGAYEQITWEPKGDRIGWVDGDDLFLQPDAAYNIAKRLGGESGDSISIGSKTLNKRLKERKLLVTTDEVRERITVRKMIVGNRSEVLHLHTECLMSDKPSQSSQPSHTGNTSSISRGEAEINGTVLWDGFSGASEEPSHKTVPFSGQFPHTESDIGTVGTIGTVLRIQDASSEKQDCNNQKKEIGLEEIEL